MNKFNKQKYFDTLSTRCALFLSKGNTMKRFFLVLILLSPPVFSDNCENPRDNFDGLYCLNKVYIEADNELNDEYKSLRERLSYSQRSELREAQISWINKRNAACGLQKNEKFYVNLKCVTDMTITQTNFLREKSRECKAVGCFKQRAPQAEVNYPAEVDTIVIGPVTIDAIKGNIQLKNDDGRLSPIHNGYRLKPGQMLLVPRGASFRLGRTTFGPESHGDRWVKLQ